MVPGLGSFREKFKDYTDYYTIIGGTACDILLSEADLPFRATKDIDMILIMEDNFPEFASIFWEYIPLVDKGRVSPCQLRVKEGSYKCGWKNEENMHFYRFTEGKFGYPTMIELFSRNPGCHLEIEEGIVPKTLCQFTLQGTATGTTADSARRYSQSNIRWERATT